MKDIEIIIINDNSSDDSLKIIQNYMKSDQRIKIIDNKENRRILFSKSIGALNSKGKYIIELDQDDMFINDDAFDIIYKQSEKYQLDILHFNFISKRDKYKLTIKNKIKIFFNDISSLIKNGKKIDIQPNLKRSIFKNNICLLWGNLIKSDLYKKVIYNLWPIIINYKIIFQEDFIITFFILIYAQKYKSIGNIFYLYFNNIVSASRDYKNNSEYYLSVIFAGIIFYDYYIDSNPQDLQIILNYIYFLKDDFKKSKILHPELFNYFFAKIKTNIHLLRKDEINILKEFNISEKYDSDIYFKQNETFFYNKLLSDKVEISRTQKIIIKLSIIIICTNYKNIIKIIKFINTQNTKYLELILIYDDERKDNYNLLYNYSKSFHYIKLLDNKIKKGTLYSISKGVMLSKGKYLIILEPKCFFLNNRTFQVIFHEISEEDEDILEFNLYKVLSNKYFFLYKCKHFKSKLNLNQIKYNFEFNEIDIKKELLTNKLIKTNYLKNIIKQFSIDKINEIIDFYYNDIFDFFIEITPHTFKYISTINIYINDIDFDKFKFNDFKLEKHQMVKETIFYIGYIFDNSKDTYENKEKVVKKLFNILSVIFNKFTRVSKASLKLLNKFFACEYISQSYKDLLQLYYVSLIT